MKKLALIVFKLLLAASMYAQTNITDDGTTTPATGYLPVFNGSITTPPSYTVTNSSVFEDATGNIGIGTTAPLCPVANNPN